MKINQIWTSRGLWVVPAHQIRIRASLYFDNKRTNVYIFAYRARRSQRTGCCLTVSPVPVKSFCSAHGLPFLCTVRLIHWWIPRLNLSVAVTWCDKQQKATKKKNLKRKKKWNLRQKSFGCLSAKRTSTLLPLERVQLRACHRGCSLWFFFFFFKTMYLCAQSTPAALCDEGKEETNHKPVCSPRRCERAANLHGSLLNLADLWHH